MCHYRKAIFISKFLSCLFVCQCTFYQFPQIATTSISVLEDRISLLRRLSTCTYTVFANFEIFFDSFCTCVSAGTITRDYYFQYFFKSRNKKCLGIYGYIYIHIKSNLTYVRQWSIHKSRAMYILWEEKQRAARKKYVASSIITVYASP